MYQRSSHTANQEIVEHICHTVVESREDEHHDRHNHDKHAADEVLLLVAPAGAFYRREHQNAAEECQHKGTQQTVIQFCRHGRLRTVDQRHIHAVYRCICGEPGQMHDAGGKACADGLYV